MSYYYYLHVEKWTTWDFTKKFSQAKDAAHRWSCNEELYSEDMAKIEAWLATQPDNIQFEVGLNLMECKTPEERQAWVDKWKKKEDEKREERKREAMSTLMLRLRARRAELAAQLNKRKIVDLTTEESSSELKKARIE
jgi:hypothetical protein